ncbi:MAG: hypothetical protein ACFB4I_19520 [Cyanophyceae cyanobacterium]
MTTRIWFGLSLLVPLYFGLFSLYHAFSYDYIVQDDARLHVVWLQQFVEPQLFPDDLIAEYYRTIAPAGFKVVYWLGAQLGIEPLVFAKVLPIGLAIIATVYLFRVSLLLMNVPAGAFLTILLQNQSFWTEDDLISAAPRAFIYPIFAAFLYYLLQRSLIPCAITIVLQGLFYPQLLLISVTVLGLRLRPSPGLVSSEPDNLLTGRSPYRTPFQTHVLLLLTGLTVMAIVLLTYSQPVSEAFGPLVTATQMRAMPEFTHPGRSAYFRDSIGFFLQGTSGVLAPLYPPILWISLSLPWLLKSRLPLAKRITPKVAILGQILVAAFGLFILAHLFFLQLYLPSRYTYYSLRFVMVMATGMVVVGFLDTGKRWLCRRLQSLTPLTRQEIVLIGLTSTFLGIACWFPILPGIFLSWQNWIIGPAPAIYRFLATQPSETLIASIAQEADNLPAFTQRSVLFSQELALAFHPAYYTPMQQRARDLIRAQYSADPSILNHVIQKYDIDYWLIDRTAFEPDYFQEQPWLVHTSFNNEIQEAIAQQNPVFPQLVPNCSVVSTETLILLDAACLREATHPATRITNDYLKNQK